MTEKAAWVIGGLALVAFLGFGLYRLGQFETTDEHLWKYDRISTYWEAWGTGDFAKTYINDKPGITVALVSGLGLLAEPNPAANERRALVPEEARRYEAYQSAQTEITNVRFRFPILLMSTLILAGLFLLMRRVFGASLPALAVTILLTTNPILVGMAQIINPDSFFWLFGTLATVAYLGWLWRSSHWWAVLAGTALGLALLSKYTAFLLLPLFALLSLGELLIGKSERATLSRAWLLRHLYGWAVMLALATGLFFIFLPAAILDPSLFVKGLSQFLSAKNLPLLFILGSVVAVGLFGVWRFGTDVRLTRFHASLQRFPRFPLAFVTGMLGVLFLLSLVNAWSGQALVPVDALRDAAYANEPQAFNFRPILEKTTPVHERWFSFFLVESAPLFFSLTPLLLLLVIAGGIGISRSWLRPETRVVLFAVSAFTVLYLVLAIAAGVVTNTRYLILLYPLLALAGGLILRDGIQFLELRWPGKPVAAIILVGALLIGSMTLWSVKPFYFSYTNFLLPRAQSIHDSWGHGSYEAAQYLNRLPEAERLIIWSNSDTVCRFFVGKCLRSRRIDLSVTTPDYLVMSKRGIIKVRNHPIFENNPWPARDPAYYIDQVRYSPEWRLEILDRPDNFIGIVRFEKE